MTSQGAKPQLVVTDRQSILERARERKHGKWIERILIQCRKTLTGVGFKEFKDISEQIRNLPKLTGQASYPAWRLAVDKLIAANKDGRQLVHLEKVLAFVELCVPLGPLFDRLPRAEFDEATATPEMLGSRTFRTRPRFSSTSDVARPQEPPSILFSIIQKQKSYVMTNTNPRSL